LREGGDWHAFGVVGIGLKSGFSLTLSRISCAERATAALAFVPKAQLKHSPALKCREQVHKK
jgi:hypothetical protein